MGASLLAKAAGQSLTLLNVTTPSRAGSLPQGGCEYSPHKNLYNYYNLYNYLDLMFKRPLGSLLLITLNP